MVSRTIGSDKNDLSALYYQLENHPIRCHQQWQVQQRSLESQQQIVTFQLDPT